MSEKRVVGIDDVMKALAIREQKGSWAQVIEATGFNGATLRPHITKFLQSKERLGRAAVEKGDRVDSPYAIVEPVTLDTESILGARKRGMAWYSIALALGVNEAKVRGLCPEGAGRVYATRNGESAPAEDNRPSKDEVLAIIGRSTSAKSCLAKIADAEKAAA